MVTLTIDEATLNATRAALDERTERLDREVTKWQAAQRYRVQNDWPASENVDRALVWNIAALHETRMAQDFYAEVEPVEDHPEDSSWTNREGMPEFNGAFR